MAMNHGDVWDLDGKRFAVVMSYWRAEKRAEDAAYLRGKYTGEVVCTDEASSIETSIPEFQNTYYISVAEEDLAVADNAMWGADGHGA